MANWKEGDRVKIVKRAVSDEDRKANRYFEHMAGLTGTIANVYSEDELALRVDPPSMSKVSQDVHKVAAERMRARFAKEASEEAKKMLTPEELSFDVHYMLLVRSADLEKV